MKPMYIHATEIKKPQLLSTKLNTVCYPGDGSREWGGGGTAGENQKTQGKSGKEIGSQ